jgi:hypothetical protein
MDFENVAGRVDTGKRFRAMVLLAASQFKPTRVAFLHPMQTQERGAQSSACWPLFWDVGPSHIRVPAASLPCDSLLT